MSMLILGGCGSMETATGLDSCWFADKRPLGIIVTKPTFRMEISQTSTSPTTAEELGQRIVNASKQYVDCAVFPLLGGLVNVEPTGGDVRSSAEGFGIGIPIGHNPYQEVYTFSQGGICLIQALEPLFGKSVRVFWVDADLNVIGTHVKDGGKSYVQGFDATLGSQYRRNNGTNVSAVLVTVFYGLNFSREFNNSAIFTLPDIPKGNKLVSITDAVGVHGVGVISFRLRLACSNTNVSATLMPYLDPENFVLVNSGETFVPAFIQMHLEADPTVSLIEAEFGGFPENSMFSLTTQLHYNEALYEFLPKAGLALSEKPVLITTSGF